jgi:phosphoribosylformylglycinamidine synthase
MLTAEETRKLALEWGLTEAEYDRIVSGIGRLPTVTEVAMFSVEWCEHCGYPKSRALLGKLPKTSSRCRVLVGADTGGFYLTDDLAAVMKVESHNHPSQVEPFQGAATGVGGIIRDIFTVGARPIASGNSLRFGDLSDAYTRYLVDGVVRGIAHYGNCLIASERFVWRDASGVHFDTIGRFVEARLRPGEGTAELEACAGITTLSLDPQTLRTCWRPVRRLFRRQVRSLVRLRTSLGRRLTVTPDHPMVIRDKGGWCVVPADALQVGDSLPILTALPKHQPDEPALAPALDLLAAWTDCDQSGTQVFVALPESWRPTASVRAALRAIEPSISTRHRYLSKGRFPIAHFLQIEADLGVSREAVTLFRAGGKANHLRAVIHPDEAFARLLGYYLSEGCVSRNGSTYKIVFTFARHEREYVEDVKQALDALGLRVCVEERRSTIAVYATSWLFGQLLKESWKCGTGAREKAVPAFVFLWPRRMRRELLKGILRGDGSMTTRCHGSHAKVHFSSTSRTLFEQVLTLVQDQGAVASTYELSGGEGHIQGRTIRNAPSWHLEVCNLAGLSALSDMFGVDRSAVLHTALARYQGDRFSFPRFHVEGDLATVKIRSVDRFDAEPSVVYDVMVDGTHLFATTGGIVTHNCIGVPTVAGEVQFHPSYRGNCLVNALAVGIAPVSSLLPAAAAGPGNPVIYVGASTGRDGIGGCSVLASHEFGEGEEKRPTVQIGDPFTEKCLIEACLEAAATGDIVAMKDMGAAGVTCTTSEMAAAGGVGMRVDLDKIPRREAGMQPYEVMMSESQERMLLVGRRGREEALAAIFRKWGLNAVVVGEVTADGILTIVDRGEVVASLPAEFLTSPPRYQMPAQEPEYLAATRRADLERVPEPRDYGQALQTLLASPNIACKRWVWEQYDHTVQAGTVVGPGGDAAVLRVKEAPPLGLALSMDGNSRRCYLDPYEGARQQVVEAARNLSCVGAEPMIVTDGLNFGNPDKPDRYWQFARCVEGIADACRQLDLAVVSGNVSFYNESPEGPIYPTPIIGMLGVLPDVSRHATIAFKADGDRILLVGDTSVPTNAWLGGSEYLAVVHGRDEGALPALDIERERRLQAVVRDLIRAGKIRSAHDCSDGGLAVALAECCIAGGHGAQVALPSPPLSAALFGEAPSRILISISPETEEFVLNQLSEASVPAVVLGQVRGHNTREAAPVALSIDGALSVPVSALEEAWEQTIPAAMG